MFYDGEAGSPDVPPGFAPPLADVHAQTRPPPHTFWGGGANNSQSPQPHRLGEFIAEGLICDFKGIYPDDQ